MFLAARWRLTVVFTGILVGILAVAGVVVFLVTQSVIYDSVDADLRDQSDRNMVILSDDYHPGAVPNADDEHGEGGSDDEGPHEFDPGGYYYAIVNPDGTLRENSSGVADTWLVSQNHLDEAVAHGHKTVDVGGDRRVYVVSTAESDGDAVLLEVGRSIESEKHALSELQLILVLVVLGSTIPALAAGYLLSGRALGPIKRSIEAQQAFIADASHELRTPVAVVRTNADILERHIESNRLGQTPSDTRAVQDIISETERMAKLVSQMLTLAQADAGQSILSQSALKLDELADEVGRSMRALAEARGVSLTIDATPSVWVNGDRDRLREVMVTLLDNAIKYTDSGGSVRLAVERAHRRATLRVSDTGHGISQEALAHVFERFYRADKARSREEGGTGLGLAIAQHIVAAHHGEIHINSEVGKGTTITVELRLLARESATEATRLPEASA